MNENVTEMLRLLLKLFANSNAVIKLVSFMILNSGLIIHAPKSQTSNRKVHGGDIASLK